LRFARFDCNRPVRCALLIGAWCDDAALPAAMTHHTGPGISTNLAVNSAFPVSFDARVMPPGPGGAGLDATGESMFAKILHRPALAIVISVFFVFLGVLGIKMLPIAQFPDIAPPTVMVSISYPGASANVLVESVLIPLEQSINGVQNMRFITSSATSAGEAAIIIYFEPGTDP